MAVTLRNAITGDRQEVDVEGRQTVREAVEMSGFIMPGNQFSVRNKFGQVVDEDAAVNHEGTVLTVGLQGDRVRGGCLACAL